MFPRTVRPPTSQASAWIWLAISLLIVPSSRICPPWLTSLQPTVPLLLVQEFAVTQPAKPTRLAPLALSIAKLVANCRLKSVQPNRLLTESSKGNVTLLAFTEEIANMLSLLVLHLALGLSLGLRLLNGGQCEEEDQSRSSSGTGPTSGAQCVQSPE